MTSLLTQDIADTPAFNKFLEEECRRRHPCTVLLEICHKLNLDEPVYEFPIQLTTQPNST